MSSSQMPPSRAAASNKILTVAKACSAKLGGFFPALDACGSVSKGIMHGPSAPAPGTVTKNRLEKVRGET